MSNQTLSWRAPEFRHYEKNAGWYITLFAVAVLVVGFFIIEKDIFAAVTCGILALLVLFFSRQRPEIVHIELTNRGIHFGNIFFPYKQLQYFWVVHNENHKTINFHASTLINNTIILELENQDPEEAHNFLIQYLPEHTETAETTMQRIIHSLKF